MHAIKSIVRGFFAIQAAILLLIPLAAILGGLRTHLGTYLVRSASASAHHTQARLIVSAVIAGMVACGLLFAMAWWTTRAAKPGSPVWPIAASVVNLGEGMLALVASHLTRGRVSVSFGDSLWCIALGAIGLFLFARRKADSTPSSAPVKRNPVAGDRTSAFARNAVTVLSVVAQLAAILLWSSWAHSRDLFRVYGVAWIALVIVASLLSTMIHECGHALIAWCFEMSLLSFKVGPLQWVKREGKWNFKLRLAGMLTPGGAVGAVSKNPNQPRWEEILMIAAGSLANLLIGIPAAYAVINDDWPHYQQTWQLVAFTASFCIISAILNLVPFLSEEGAYSDGARILQIITDSPIEEYHKTISGIALTATTEVRYRDLDVAAIQRAAKLFPDEFRGLHLNLCACHCFEDASRFPEAAVALATAEAIYNNFAIDLPAPLHTVFVIGHAYLNRDAAAARTWWDRMEAKKNDRQNVDYWLARTALLWIEGDAKGAEQAWVEADSLAQALPKCGAYEFDRFRCFLLRQQLNENVIPRATPALAPAASVPQPIEAAEDPETASPILPAWITPASPAAVERNSGHGQHLDSSAADVPGPTSKAARNLAAQSGSYSDSASMFARLSSLTARPAPITQTEGQRLPDVSTKIDAASESKTEAQGGVQENGLASDTDTKDLHSDFLDWGKALDEDRNTQASGPEDTASSDELTQFLAPDLRPNEMFSARPIAPLHAGTASITPLPVEEWKSLPSSVAPSFGVSSEGGESGPQTLPSQSQVPFPPPVPVTLPSSAATPLAARTVQLDPLEVKIQTPSKGPSVPAAFARRPRVVGPITEFSFSDPIIAETSTIASDGATVLEQEQTQAPFGLPNADGEAPDAALSDATIRPPNAEHEANTKSTFEPAATVPIAVESAPAPPAPAPVEAPKFDPLAFIRAAAIENLSTSR